MDLIDEFPYYKLEDLSHYFQEQITFLFFNLTRKDDSVVIEKIGDSFSQVLQLLKKELIQHRRFGFSDNDFPYLQYLIIVYNLVAHTRDITCGKGEHELYYMLIYRLYCVFPNLAVFLLYKTGYYGCWRDIKYLCLYVKEHSQKNTLVNNSLFSVCVHLLNQQLKGDIDSWTFSIHAGSRNMISNVGKWIPRERSRFTWLFELLAIDWSRQYGRWNIDDIDITSNNYGLALDKCKRIYRKVISKMNRHLDTTEIKQCSQKWDEINPTTVSKYTVMKQPGLFLSYPNDFNDFNDFNESLEPPPINTILKMKCSQKYIIENLQMANEVGGLDNSTSVVRPFCDIIQLPVSYFVKEALNIIRNNRNCKVTSARRILNLKWDIFSRNHFGNYDSILPILDVSYKMLENDSESFYTGLGMSILICMKSSFGKRILVLENNPVWINLEDSVDFVSAIENFSQIIQSHHNTAFSFERGIDLVVNAIQESGFKYNNMKIVLFSNNFTGNIDNYYDYFEKQFIRSFTPLKCRLNIPKLVFWNLSKKEICELPNEKTLVNSILLSGFSSNLIKNISYPNINDTTFSVICRILDNKKYGVLEEYLQKCFTIEGNRRFPPNPHPFL